MTRYSIFMILIVILFTQCKTDQSKQQASEVNADSLQTQLLTLNDSLQSSWNTMIASDDQKISEIGTLLQGIAKSCKYNKASYDQVLKQQSQLAAKRYVSSDSMTNEQIDRYDSATDSLLSDLHTFYEKTNASACCPDCDSVLSDIEKQHGEVVMYRIRYDNHAKEFNALITQQKTILSTLKPEYKNLKTKQLFSLMQ